MTLSQMPLLFAFIGRPEGGDYEYCLTDWETSWYAPAVRGGMS